MPDPTTPDSPCPGRDQLQAYLWGRLPADVARSITEHVTACRNCESSLVDLVRPVADPRADPAATKTFDAGAAPTAAQPITPEQGPRPPEAFGRFVLLDRLPVGGMGVVYHALDPLLKRLVALKRLHPSLIDRADARARFARECEAIARLDHPNVVRVFEAGFVWDEPFFAMEFVAGGTLSKRLRAAPLSGRDAAAVVEAVARAVHHAHQADVLHRDLKPANVLIAKDGTPKVADFGLARFRDADPADALTGTGEFLGTPQYMSPEQVRGDLKALGPWTDVYGVGAILYEALTGRPPFVGLPHEVRAMVPVVPPDPPRKLWPDLDPHLEAVCLKCLEKEPARRYQSAAELADDLALWRKYGYARVQPASRLTKAARWVRRHPALTAAVVLAVAVAGAAPYVRAAADPDRAAKAAVRQLEAGQPATLVDADGVPRVRPKVVLGSADVIVPKGTPGAADPGPGSEPPKDGDQLFVRGTENPALLELLPRVPPPAYRFSAQLSFSGDHGDRAGIYFAANAGPAELAYLRIDYSESTMVPLPKPKGNPNAPFPMGPGPGEALFQSDWVSLPQADDRRASRRGKPFTFDPRRGEAAWRTLAVEVSPTGARWFWDGAAAGFVNSVDFGAAADKLVPVAGGGCGVYVRSASVRVRNVTVTPLRSP